MIIIKPISYTKKPVMVEILKDDTGKVFVISDTVRASSNYADGEAWVSFSKLYLNVMDKDTTIVLVVDSLRQVIRESEITLIHNTEVIKEKDSLIDRLRHNIRLMFLGGGLFALFFFFIIPIVKPHLPKLRK